MTDAPTYRSDPPVLADEKATMIGFLDYQRATFRWKVSGLDQEQLNRTLAPTDMTLGGMLKHMALNEWWWFESTFAGDDPEGGGYAMTGASDEDDDWDWHTAAGDSPDTLLGWWTARVAAADAVITANELDALSVRPSRREDSQFTLRWIVLHMIEEYARHIGHADLLRQSIDGQTGE
jgi:hypothetical protein